MITDEDILCQPLPAVLSFLLLNCKTFFGPTPINTVQGHRSLPHKLPPKELGHPVGTVRENGQKFDSSFGNVQTISPHYEMSERVYVVKLILRACPRQSHQNYTIPLTDEPFVCSICKWNKGSFALSLWRERTLYFPQCYRAVFSFATKFCARRNPPY